MVAVGVSSRGQGLLSVAFPVSPAPETALALSGTQRTFVGLEPGSRGDWREVAGSRLLFETESVGLAAELDMGYKGKEEIKMTSRFWFEKLSEWKYN